MVERKNRLNGSTFLGCSDVPTCRETAPIPAWLILKRAGVMELPGMETEP